MSPHEIAYYECDHMRPVVRTGGGWHHVLHGEVAAGPCEAGVYCLTVTIDEPHYVSRLVSKDRCETDHF